MTLTLSEIADGFQSFLSSLPEDVTEPGDDVLYLEVVLKEIEAIQLSFAGAENAEFLELTTACSRIPGLLHLYKLY